MSEQIPVILFCPLCKVQHIDPRHKGPHKTHDCHYCGCTWTPAAINTRGVVEIDVCDRSLEDTWPVKPPLIRNICEFKK